MTEDYLFGADRAWLPVIRAHLELESPNQQTVLKMDCVNLALIGFLLYVILVVVWLTFVFSYSSLTCFLATPLIAIGGTVVWGRPVWVRWTIRIQQKSGEEILIRLRGDMDGDRLGFQWTDDGSGIRIKRIGDLNRVSYHILEIQKLGDGEPLQRPLSLLKFLRKYTTELA